MSSNNYNWIRYWYLRESKTPLTEDGLFLRVDSQLRFLYGLSDVEPSEISSLLNIPCLILLGEPGMGKSYVLEDLKEKLSNSDENRYSFFDLGDFTSPNDLVTEVFSNNTDFAEWQASDFCLHLFLDSLDEVRTQLKGIIRQIHDFLKVHRANLNRLHLRLVCRMSDWSLDYEKRLKQLWGDNTVAAYILAPLQEEDISLAARQNGIDTNLFWNEVRQKEAISFAARPLTLRFLISEFLRTGQLPRTKHELYRKGCTELCKEINSIHLERLKTEYEQRFIIASRIAAMMLFTKHTSISRRPLIEDESTTLAAEVCSGGKEAINNFDFPVYDSNVQETLDTALFRGGDVRQWAHQAYAEFLAAWYVTEIFEIPQIKSLIFHPDGQLIPELHETAAWIASFNQEIFEAILLSDPEVLLRSDVSTGDNDSKARLVKALLRWREENPHSDFEWKRLSVLKCPDLARIIQPYIEDMSGNTQSRELAVDIATECMETTLQEPMARIALNLEEPLHLRITAAEGLVAIGDEKTKLQLKPLALLPLDTRERSQLKLQGIKASWPHTLTAVELFQTLEVPFESQYLSFMNWKDLILPGLDVKDLPVALEWVQRQEYFHNLSYSFCELLDGILLFAWQEMEEPLVAEAFARTAVVLWAKHEDIFDRHGRRKVLNSQTGLSEEVIMADNRKRHLLLEHLFLIATNHRNTDYEVVNDVPLLYFNDAPWLIERFNQGHSPHEQVLAVEFLHRIIDLYQPEHFEFIYNVGLENPVLWRALGYQLEIQLGSEEAERARRIYLRRGKAIESEQQEERTERILDRLAVEMVSKYVDEFEKGNVDSWWQMNRWVTYYNSNFHGDYEREYDFRKLPFWSELSDSLKSKIVDSALQYINNYDPDSGVCDHWWQKPDWIFWAVVAGCRAFSLIIVSNLVESLSPANWRKWAPALTYYIYHSIPYSKDSSVRESKRLFLRMLKVSAPEETIETFLWIAESENKTTHFSFPYELEYLWDEYLAQEFLAKVQDGEYTSANTIRLIEGLSDYNFGLVEAFVKSWVGLPIPVESDDREQAIVAAKLLIKHLEDAGWPIIWPVIQQDPEFGREVIMRVISTDRHGAFITSKLTGEETTDLYIWLFRQFPPEEDPDHDGPLTVEHDIARFRNHIPRHLAAQGTTSSIQQLKRAQETLGLNLSYYISQAERIWRQNTWQPITPQEFKELVNNNQARLVHSGGQLLDVIIEALDKLNLELQGLIGATPAAIDLWNENKVNRNGKWQYYCVPKDENRLSDYVERFLKREFEGKSVFISREAQIRRGNHTDIYIEAKPSLPNDDLSSPITVIVEVKGCWHPKLETAMQEQLVERYLSQSGLKHGIFLIGRFMCDAWNYEEGGDAWNRSSKVIDSELLDFLTHQAEQFSPSGFDIRVFLLNARV